MKAGRQVGRFVALVGLSVGLAGFVGGLVGKYVDIIRFSVPRFQGFIANKWGSSH